LDQALGDRFQHLIQTQRAENRVGDFVQRLHVGDLLALRGGDLQPPQHRGELMREDLQQRNMRGRRAVPGLGALHAQQAEHLVEGTQRDVGSVQRAREDQLVLMTGNQRAQRRSREDRDLFFSRHDVAVHHQLLGLERLGRLIKEKHRRALNFHRLAEEKERVRQELRRLPRDQRPAPPEPRRRRQRKALKLLADLLERVVVVSHRGEASPTRQTSGGSPLSHGERVLGRGFLQLAQNLPANTVYLLQHVVVPKSNNAKPLFRHVEGTIGILLYSHVVLSSINFDNQMFFHTAEVGEKWT